MKNRRYETLFLLHSDLPEEELAEIQKKCTDVIDGTNGRLLELGDWGHRQLAYEIKGQARGFYFLMDYAGTPEMLTEIERLMGLDERVFRYMTIVQEKIFDEKKYERDQAQKEEEARKTREEAEARQAALEAEAAAESAQDDAEQAAAESAQDDGEQAAEESAQDDAEEAAEESAQDDVEEAAEESAQDDVEEAAEESNGAPVEEEAAPETPMEDEQAEPESDDSEEDVIAQTVVNSASE